MKKTQDREAITLTCRCGEVFHTAASQEGHHILCPRCKQILTIEIRAQEETSMPFARKKPDGTSKSVESVCHGLAGMAGGAVLAAAGAGGTYLLAKIAQNSGFIIIVGLPMLLFISGLVAIFSGLAEVGRGFSEMIFGRKSNLFVILFIGFVVATLAAGTASYF